MFLITLCLICTGDSRLNPPCFVVDVVIFLLGFQEADVLEAAIAKAHKTKQRGG